MKKQTRFQIASLLIGCILTSGLLIQSQLFSQTVLSSSVNTTSTATPIASDVGQTSLPLEHLHIDAGEDAIVCIEDSTYPLNGTSNYTGLIMWETSGDGEFSDPMSLNPTYLPGDYDISNGQVTLFLYMLKSGNDVSPNFDLVVLSYINCINSGADDDL